MAFDNKWIDRYKAIGFYKHVEWDRKYGVLVRIFEKDSKGRTPIEFEAGTFDVEYDQKFESYRQVYLSRKEAVNMMLNLGFNVFKIAKVFRNIDGRNNVREFV